jgi:hypothetical protein
MGGFEVVPAVLTDAETDCVLTAVSGRKRSRAGARHLMGNAAVSGVARDRRLLDLASAALGMSAVPYRATLFDKSLASNWLVVWHQDTALPLEHRRDAVGWGPWSTKAGVVYAHAPASALQRIVALRVHLDDSTSENGPLRVIPGSHELGVRSARARRARAAPRMHRGPRRHHRDAAPSRPCLVEIGRSRVAARPAPRVRVHDELRAGPAVARGLTACRVRPRR